MSAIARRTAQELEEAMARIAALEAELAEARRERYDYRAAWQGARSAALEEAARYIEGLGMPGAVGIRALMQEPKP